MNRKTATRLFTLFYVLSLGVIFFLSLWDLGSRTNGKVPAITYAHTEQYVLLVAAALIFLVCTLFTYKKGNLMLPSALVRTGPVCGVLAVAAGAGFIWEAVTRFLSAVSIAEYISVALAVGSGVLMLYLANVHFCGGTDGLGNLFLFGSLMPLIYFLMRLTLLFFSESSFYPTVDNVLEQILMTTSLLYFLGLCKDVWVSGAKYGRKLMFLFGLFTLVLTVIRVIAPAVFHLMNGSFAQFGDDLMRFVVYLPLSMYMTSTGFLLIRHSV